MNPHFEKGSEIICSGIGVSFKGYFIIKCRFLALFNKLSDFSQDLVMLQTGRHYLSIKINKDVRKTPNIVCRFVTIIIESYPERKISLKYLLSKRHLGLRFKFEIMHETMSLIIEEV